MLAWRSRTSSATLAIVVAGRTTRCLVRVIRYGSALHLRVVRVVVVHGARGDLRSAVGSRQVAVWEHVDLLNKGGGSWVFRAQRRCYV
jgi:hypothetical protein